MSLTDFNILKVELPLPKIWRTKVSPTTREPLRTLVMLSTALHTTFTWYSQWVSARCHHGYLPNPLNTRRNDFSSMLPDKYKHKTCAQWQWKLTWFLRRFVHLRRFQRAVLFRGFSLLFHTHKKMNMERSCGGEFKWDTREALKKERKNMQRYRYVWGIKEEIRQLMLSPLTTVVVSAQSRSWWLHELRGTTFR